MTAKIKLNAASGGGSFSLQAPSSSSNNRVMTLPDTADGTILTTTNPKAGNIIQVVHVNSNTHQSSTSTSYVDLSGVTATITPGSSTNKIFISCSIAISKQEENNFLGRILKDGSVITGAGGVAESGHGNQVDGVWWNIRNTIYAALSYTVQYSDTAGGTSAITYKAQGLTTNSSYGFTLNRTQNGGNDKLQSPAFSSITLMEIAG